MTTSIPDNPKRRGRPSTGGRNQLIGVRLSPRDIELLDQWIEADGQRASRPEAMRRILRLVAARTPMAG